MLNFYPLTTTKKDLTNPNDTSPCYTFFFCILRLTQLLFNIYITVFTLLLSIGQWAYEKKPLRNI